jgi:hypothetical protein
VLSACSGGGDSPQTDFELPANELPNDNPEEENVPDIDNQGDPQSDPTDDVDIVRERFPVDTEGDDRPGLIVSGVGVGNADKLMSPWLVNLQIFRNSPFDANATPGDGRVELVQYQDNFEVESHVDFYTPDLGRCLIRDLSAPSGTQGEDGDNVPPLVSGGSTVVINSPSGPWFEFPAEVQANGAVEYEVVDQLPGALPAKASLSIPGNVFPNVAEYPLYEPEPVIRILPDPNDPITAATSYSWFPENAKTFIKLDFLAFNDTGEFQGFPVTCFATDEGRFTPTDEAVQALLNSPFNIELRYSRTYSRVDAYNGIAFRQAITIAE